MIIDFSVNFNNYTEKILNYYGFWDYRCPCCNALHSFTRHAVYPRNICFFNSGLVEEKQISILRLACNSCNRTHAILPSDTIPYFIYAFSFIFQVLLNHFEYEKSVISISTKNQISFQLIYLFIKRFINHFNPCISFLRVFLAVQLNFTSSFKNLILAIAKNSNPLDFQREYFNYSKLIFLSVRNQNILSRKVHIGVYFKPPT